MTPAVGSRGHNLLFQGAVTVFYFIPGCGYCEGDKHNKHVKLNCNFIFVNDDVSTGATLMSQSFFVTSEMGYFLLISFF